MENKYLFDVYDVMDTLNCKKTTAYKIIKRINSKLLKKGMTVIPGKVSKVYFFREYGLYLKEEGTKI